MLKTILTGNVGADSVSHDANDGGVFVTFSVAVAIGTKTNPKTEWVDVSCNGKLAEIAAGYVKKGMKVLIEGFPKTRVVFYEKSNEHVAKLQIYANTIEFLSSATQNSDNPQSNQPTEKQINTGGYTSPNNNTEPKKASYHKDSIPF